MNWGRWIIVSFILFAMFIGTLVVICVRQDTPLVSKQYYQEELDYQNQIDRIENANALVESPDITIVKDSLRITYIRFSEMENGKIKLFRPSDPRLDRQYDVPSSTQESQAFSIRDLQKGLYKARLLWEQDGKEFYLEKTIVL
jgi:hypothetical protein